MRAAKRIAAECGPPCWAMHDPASVTAFFVYGTLQRGQCRQRCWPVPAVRVDRAFARGQLYDLGEYPAMLPGDDWVAGERWELAAADLPRVLRVLDRVEGYAQPGEDDLYDRQVIPIYAAPHSPLWCQAWTYVLKDLRMLRQAHRVEPTPLAGQPCRYAQWPAAGAS